MKKMVFESFDQFENWAEEAEDFREVAILIDDGWRISCDMETDCKSWKTALKRFEKAFSSDPVLKNWIEGMQESCNNGTFEDVTGCYPSWTNDPEEVREFLKGGAYGFGVEEICEGTWYVFLNVSGCYAER